MARKDQKQQPANDVIAAKPARRKRDDVRDANLGTALRSVYSQTVDEAIPREFLDLLNKLD